MGLAKYAVQCDGEVSLLEAEGFHREGRKTVHVGMSLVRSCSTKMGENEIQMTS